MQQHIKIIGILFMVFGGLGLLVAIAIFVVGAGAGLASGESEGAAAGFGFGAIVGAIVGILALPNLITGWGLIKHKSWSRMVAIVLAAISLLNIPLGTAFGAYTIWALIQPDSKNILSN